jgi:HEAT repeat protein
MRTIFCVGAALLLCGCGKSTGEWVAQLHSPDSAERLHAAHELGARKAEAATVVPALTEALKDADGFVRKEAAHSLSKIGPEAREATAALLVALRDKKRDVRQAAAGALKEIDPEAASRAGVR